MDTTPTEQVPLTITVERAGQLLGISRGLAYDLVRRGEIPAIRLGRRVVVPASAIDEILRTAAEGPRPWIPASATRWPRRVRYPSRSSRRLTKASSRSRRPPCALTTTLGGAASPLICEMRPCVRPDGGSALSARRRPFVAKPHDVRGTSSVSRAGKGARSLEGPEQAL